jgi:hypothetical protein
MTTYYVKNGGSNTNTGLSDSQAWATLSRIASESLSPGDIVCLKRGSTWDEELTLTYSGTSGNYITITDYDEGDLPQISNSDTVGEDVVINADYVIVENLLLDTASRRGVYIEGTGSDHNIIRNCEITDVGNGIRIEGDYCLVTGNYIHDTKMITNDPVPTNNDSGATGVWVAYGDYNEISYNVFDTCKAFSYDYGQDGGALELWNGGTGTEFHHNWVINCDGVIELGSNINAEIYDARVHHNVCINNDAFTLLSLAGAAYPADVDNFRIECNTIYQDDTTIRSDICRFNGTPTTDMFVSRNNIFHVADINVYDEPTITHEYNLYYLDGTATLGVTADDTEILDDPDFVSIEGEDFHLQSTSPAINAGTDLGDSTDYDDNPIDAIPDIGAYEYQSTYAVRTDDANLQGYWPLDESSGTRFDRTDNENDLGDNHTVGYDATGGPDGEPCADFESDNTEYLSITDAAQTGLNLTGDATLIVWFNPETLGPNNLMSKYDTSGHQRSFNLYVDDAEVKCTLSPNGSTFPTAIAGATISTGTWYYLAAVYDGSDVRIYVNGALSTNGSDNPMAYSGGIYDGTAEFQIGNRSNSYCADGLMCHAMVFDRALSANEILNIYEYGLWELGTVTHVLGTVLESPTQSSSHVLETVLKTTGLTQSHVLGANLKAMGMTTHALGANLRAEGQAATHVLEAVLKTTGLTSSHVSSANLKAMLTTTHVLGTNLRAEGQAATYILDVVLKTTGLTETHVLGAVLEATGTTTHVLGANFRAEGKTTTQVLETVLKTTGLTGDHVLDAVLEATPTATHILIAPLMGEGLTATHVMGANLTDSYNPTHVLYAVLEARAQTTTHALEAVLKTTGLTQSHVLWANLKATPTTTHVLGANFLAEGQTSTQVLDAVLEARAQAATNVLGANLKTTSTTTHVLGANLKATPTTTHALGANLLAEGQTATQVLDAILEARVQVETYVLDAILEATSTANHMLWANLKTTPTTTHVLGVNLKATPTTTYALDANLLAEGQTATQVLDAILEARVQVETYVLDAILEARAQTASHVLWADLRKMIEHKLQAILAKDLTPMEEMEGQVVGPMAMTGQVVGPMAMTGRVKTVISLEGDLDSN